MFTGGVEFTTERSYVTSSRQSESCDLHFFLSVIFIFFFFIIEKKGERDEKCRGERKLRMVKKEGWDSELLSQQSRGYEEGRQGAV